MYIMVPFEVVYYVCYGQCSHTNGKTGSNASDCCRFGSMIKNEPRALFIVSHHKHLGFLFPILIFLTWEKNVCLVNIIWRKQNKSPDMPWPTLRPWRCNFSNDCVRVWDGCAVVYLTNLLLCELPPVCLRRTVLYRTHYLCYPCSMIALGKIPRGRKTGPKGVYNWKARTEAPNCFPEKRGLQWGRHHGASRNTAVLSWCHFGKWKQYLAVICTLVRWFKCSN